LQQEDNAALSSEIDSLGAAVFAKTGNANWTGSRLAALLKQQRKATGDQPSRQTHRLPKLNPQ
jgi:homospermidine synthase